MSVGLITRFKLMYIHCKLMHMTELVFLESDLG